MKKKAEQNQTPLCPDNIGDKHRSSTNSLKNLKQPWKPGESGNPRGRPIKNKKMIKRLRAIGDERYIDSMEKFMNPPKPKPVTKREKALQKIWTDADDGNIQSIKLLIELDCL